MDSNLRNSQGKFPKGPPLPGTSICGEGLVAVIIFLAILGAGFFFLLRHKQEMECEGRIYANETIDRILFAHDQTYLPKNLSHAAELDFPPSRLEMLVAQLAAAGEPTRPIDLEGELKFESYFFNPSGVFHTTLLFLRGPGELTLKVSHPGDKWQIESVTFNWKLY